MKITNVRFVHLEGVLEHEGDLWEERTVYPMDLYPDHRDKGAHLTPKLGEGRYLVQSVFVLVETDEGVTGWAGPIDEAQAYIINYDLKSLVLGEDPLATERIWDRLYRSTEAHGRKGIPMQALSALDCALWDLKGKWAGLPVYRLLGGPTRDIIPVYASALGYALQPDSLGRRTQEIIEEGYRAMKWFFRHGPGSGQEGMAKNVAQVRTLREAAGDEMEIMLDCWQSWDYPYTIAMAEQLAEYRPRWIEEPVLPDRIDSCAAIRRTISIPIATGEHEYTRWGLKMLMDAAAADVLQPDIYWAGGMTEMVKICALASTYDVQIIPHGHSVPATVHLIASQPANVCPLLEYLIIWNQIHQFFFKNPIHPRNGIVTLPEEPGMGLELDENKIQARRELRWEHP
ncbi:MAG: mandelate racemase/muconate lactonizing protein [Chloroflexi bacterium]|nr:mandelate racemase/muconate lactonizing protein [Chloroflexota bacterium]